MSSWGAGRPAVLSASRAAVSGVCALLHSDTPDAVEDAAGLLCNMLLPDPSGKAREPLDAADVAPLLAPIVNVGYYLAGLRAAPVAVAAMANVATTARGCAALLACQAHMLLVGLLRCGAAVAGDIRESAAIALLNISQVRGRARSRPRCWRRVAILVGCLAPGPLVRESRQPRSLGATLLLSSSLTFIDSDSLSDS